MGRRPQFRFTVCASAFTCLLLLVSVVPTAFAETYPTRPIRLVVGPSTDLVPRLMGQKLSGMWGQQVVVDVRPGGGGTIAAEIVSKAAPDGYTWLLSSAAYTINMGLYANLPYNMVRDFAPVALLTAGAFYLVVHPTVPAKSVAELIQLARAKPGTLNFASSGNGTPPHLAGEMLKSMAHINIVHVPYRNAAAATTDLLGGQVQFAFLFGPVALPHVKTGKLKALGVSSITRALAAPELPTIAESGLPGFEVVGWVGVHAPTHTPKSLIAKINHDMLEVLKQPDVQERIASGGLEPAGKTPEQFDAFVRTDIDRWTKVIRDAGIHAE
jgi:tripartite-type tricarboxylate transporter receptor subunit TctC